MAEFVEYPKWIKLPDGSDVIVQNREEENEKLGIVAETPPAPETVTHTVDPSPEIDAPDDGASDDPEEAEPSPKRKARKK